MVDFTFAGDFVSTCRNRLQVLRFPGPFVPKRVVLLLDAAVPFPHGRNVPAQTCCQGLVTLHRRFEALLDESPSRILELFRNLGVGIRAPGKWHRDSGSR